MSIDNIISGTFADLMENMRALASSPEARRKFEEEQRKMLEPGVSFWVDEMGVGHFHGNLYVSVCEGKS
jgi:hypothetical protein